MSCNQILQTSLHPNKIFPSFLQIKNSRKYNDFSGFFGYDNGDVSVEVKKLLSYVLSF